MTDKLTISDYTEYTDIKILNSARHSMRTGFSYSLEFSHPDWSNTVTVSSKGLQDLFNYGITIEDNVIKTPCVLCTFDSTGGIITNNHPNLRNTEKFIDKKMKLSELKRGDLVGTKKDEYLYVGKVRSTFKVTICGDKLVPDGVDWRGKPKTKKVVDHSKVLYEDTFKETAHHFVSTEIKNSIRVYNYSDLKNVINISRYGGNLIEELDYLEVTEPNKLEITPSDKLSNKLWNLTREYNVYGSNKVIEVLESNYA